MFPSCRRWTAVAHSVGLAFATSLILLNSDVTAYGQPPDKSSTVTLQLGSIEGLELAGGKAENATYKGRRAVRLVPPDHPGDSDAMMAIIPGTDFKDGTIEVDVAGSPRPGADADARGFIGVAFRVQDHGAHGENIYLRPTNGRADDQLRRSHSVQYESIPDYPWYRLRKEHPGVYESYVDLQAGEWTRMRIVVSGTKAQLYVNGAAEPCLIVNDLKLGDSRGQIALWAHSSTDGYFSNLTITTSK